MFDTRGLTHGLDTHGLDGWRVLADERQRSLLRDAEQRRLARRLRRRAGA